MPDGPQLVTLGRLGTLPQELNAFIRLPRIRKTSTSMTLQRDIRLIGTKSDAKSMNVTGINAQTAGVEVLNFTPTTSFH